MCLSTKRPSPTFDTIHAVLFLYVLSGFIISASSYSVNVSAPVFVDGQMETVKCLIDNSVLNIVNCPASFIPIEFLEIVLTKNTITKKLCVFSSFINCARFSQDSLATSCECYSDGSDIYSVNVTVNADRNNFDNATIDCIPSCIDNNGDYPLQSSYTGIPIKFVPTTSQSTTTVTVPTTSQSTTTVTVPECWDCNCNDTCTCPKNCTDKCPVWCIVVAVCVPCGGCGIIIIIVIIIKKKKAQTPGKSCTDESSEGGRNGTKQAVQDTKEMKDRTKHHGTENSVQNTNEMQDKTKHHGTENRPKPAQGGSNRTEERPKPAQDGSNRTEESVQDTNEMQDKTKHLGTENSAQ